jgi:hypothetical protein
MTPQRGTRQSDVLSRRLYGAAELQGFRVQITPETILAIWLFLSRHAERRAYVVVRGDDHGSKEGERGDG